MLQVRVVLLLRDWHSKRHAGLESPGHFCMDHVATVKSDRDALPGMGAFRNCDLYQAIFGNARNVRGSKHLLIGIRRHRCRFRRLLLRRILIFLV